MTTPRPAIFRDALQVSASRIAALDDVALSSLMNELIVAQAYRCGAAVEKIRVNTEERAEDEGCDAWSPRPVENDSWLGESDTCWQLKAGTAGQPSKLKGEITKRIPTETLRAGGRFVVVASGSTNGKSGEEARLEALQKDAAKIAGIPLDKIDVIGSERLTNWCNQHPAIAAKYAGRPDALSRLDDWLREAAHKIPWQATQSLQDEIQKVRSDLDPKTGSVTHVHIQGPPGVGKSRFALEVCRGADWQSTVIYVRQASDLRLTELIDSAKFEQDVLLTIVADEVQKNQLRPLYDSVSLAEGRVRLITIGHSGTPDPGIIPTIKIGPLPTDAIKGVIKGWHPGMPAEHVDFVARFADGYVRLAKLGADAVVHNPTVDVRTLLDLEHIRQFFDDMLGTDDRRSLHVVAVLTSVGWADDRESEGEAIARHLDLDWNQVRHDVENFNNHFGIAPPRRSLSIHFSYSAWNSSGCGSLDEISQVDANLARCSTDRGGEKRLLWAHRADG